ncbi:MAG: hypothetical protein VXW36_06565, partial [Candidatus Thermoplasmatota archaeon]|nr:hypothetical protein [Candidatus Thermoplasmatota archaeon]
RDEIEFVTISSTGDTTDFGNLLAARTYVSVCGNQTRGVIAGGNPASPANYDNVIQFITIASTGNAVDFGDLLATISSSASASNGHGGL